MLDQQLVVKISDKLQLPQAAEALVDPQIEALQVKVLDILSLHVCLELSELARLTGVSTQALRAVVDMLQKQKLAVIANYEFAACMPQIQKAHSILTDLWQSKKNIAPGDFKEALGTTRKYAMALLSYFDDHLITRRTSTGRALLRPLA
jgi:aryl-alcohol dehydrogenase-like predicted oxidoreductase